jgi:hypothetical protein
METQQTPQAKGRNFTALAIANPLDVDKKVTFVEDTHEYFTCGERVPISVTGVKSRVFEEAHFNPSLIVRKNLASWRSKPNSKYGKIAINHDDETSEQLIVQMWKNSTSLGTALHKRAEGHLNGEMMPDDGETDGTWPQLLKALDGFKDCGAKPFRTELSLIWRCSVSNNVLCAGQLDVLFKLEDDYIIGDFKCTDKDLSEDSVPFKGKRVSSGPLKGKLCNEFNKFSLQLSFYCVMLEQQCGIVVSDDNRFVIRAHPSLPEPEFVKMACFDAEARAILDSLPFMFPEKFLSASTQAETHDTALKRPKNNNN